MIMQPETGKLSVREKIGSSLGDGVANFIFQTIMLLQLSFYTNTFGIGAGAIAVLFLPGRLVGAVADPVMGYIWSFQECFSFSRLLTSSIVPLNGPGVSILIDTRAAANFNDSGTS